MGRINITEEMYSFIGQLVNLKMRPKDIAKEVYSKYGVTIGHTSLWKCMSACKDEISYEDLKSYRLVGNKQVTSKKQIISYSTIDSYYMPPIDHETASFDGLVSMFEEVIKLLGKDLKHAYYCPYLTAYGSKHPTLAECDRDGEGLFGKRWPAIREALINDRRNLIEYRQPNL